MGRLRSLNWWKRCTDRLSLGKKLDWPGLCIDSDVDSYDWSSVTDRDTISVEHQLWQLCKGSECDLGQPPPPPCLHWLTDRSGVDLRPVSFPNSTHLNTDQKYLHPHLLTGLHPHLLHWTLHHTQHLNFKVEPKTEPNECFLVRLNFLSGEVEIFLFFWGLNFFLGPIFEAHVHCTATGFKDEPRMYPNECILVRLKVFFEAHVEYRLQMRRLKVFWGPYIYLKPVLYIFFEAHICVSKNM